MAGQIFGDDVVVFRSSTAGRRVTVGLVVGGVQPVGGADGLRAAVSAGVVGGGRWQWGGLHSQGCRHPPGQPPVVAAEQGDESRHQQAPITDCLAAGEVVSCHSVPSNQEPVSGGVTMTAAEQFRAIRFALDPTVDQRQNLARRAGAASWAFNHARAAGGGVVGSRRVPSWAIGIRTEPVGRRAEIELHRSFGRCRGRPPSGGTGVGGTDAGLPRPEFGVVSEPRAGRRVPTRQSPGPAPCFPDAVVWIARQH